MPILAGGQAPSDRHRNGREEEGRECRLQEERSLGPRLIVGECFRGCQVRGISQGLESSLRELYYGSRQIVARQPARQLPIELSQWSVKDCHRNNAAHLWLMLSE